MYTVKMMSVPLFCAAQATLWVAAYASIQMKGAEFGNKYTISASMEDVNMGRNLLQSSAPLNCTGPITVATLPGMNGNSTHIDEYLFGVSTISACNDESRFQICYSFPNETLCVAVDHASRECSCIDCGASGNCDDAPLTYVDICYNKFELWLPYECWPAPDSLAVSNCSTDTRKWSSSVMGDTIVDICVDEAGTGSETCAVDVNNGYVCMAERNSCDCVQCTYWSENFVPPPGFSDSYSVADSPECASDTVDTSICTAAMDGVQPSACQLEPSEVKPSEGTLVVAPTSATTSIFVSAASVAVSAAALIVIAAL